MTAEELLDELTRPACYPNDPTGVELVQTHLSVVCLAGDLVYKLKKAVTLSFVDFGSLARRRAAAEAEVRLNRRLCPATYLGTVALRRTGGGLRFDEVGSDRAAAGDRESGGDDDGTEVIDVAVVMRRLPQDRMLDELIAAGGAGAVDVEQLRELARAIAEFHDAADRGAEVAELGAPQKLVGFASDNFRDLAGLPVTGHGLSPRLLEALARSSERGFQRLLPQLRSRAAAGRVVDGHGDLHARNICMTSPPAAYDCIEFEPAFRCSDVATEIAFLAMDLRYRGVPELAAEFVGSYVEASGDPQVQELLPLLCSYRAMVRAKVSAITASEDEIEDRARADARQSALAHVRLAAAFALEAATPWWIVVCGPPASGKSTLVAELRRALQWRSIATDPVRKELAGLQPTEAGRPEHYTFEFTRRTYGEVLGRAAGLGADLGARAIVLDGNFPTIALRSRARAAAAAASARLAIAYVDVDDQTARQRAQDRAERGGSVSDAGVEVAMDVRARYETPGPEEQPIVLAGDRPAQDLMDELLTELLRRT